MRSRLFFRVISDRAVEVRVEQVFPQHGGGCPQIVKKKYIHICITGKFFNSGYLYSYFCRNILFTCFIMINFPCNNVKSLLIVAYHGTVNKAR